MTKRTHFLVQTFRAPASEFRMSWTDNAQWQPRVDIYQTDDEILIHLEAAGLREDGLQLQYENGQLIIEGRRERPEIPCPQHCLQVEISYGSFRKVLVLPRDVDADAIRANYQNGILQIVAPRKPRPKQNVQISIS